MLSATLLREARLRAGLTQAQLAEKVGTAQSAVARWETGRTRPSLETLVDLIRACGFELQVGLGESDVDMTTLIERNLALTPEQRLSQLVSTLAFIRAGRSALAQRDDRARPVRP
jgi:transcriptional regulator with XRE-family HTH domain